MQAPIIYTKTMTGSAITLAPTAAPLVASVDIRAGSGNAGNITLTAPTGNITLAAGETVWLDNVDLNTLTVNGTASDTLKVVGNTVF
jgi:hypothetical protein